MKITVGSLVKTPYYKDNQQIYDKVKEIELIIENDFTWVTLITEGGWIIYEDQITEDFLDGCD